MSAAKPKVILCSSLVALRPNSEVWRHLLESGRTITILEHDVVRAPRQPQRGVVACTGMCREAHRQRNLLLRERSSAPMTADAPAWAPRYV